MRREVLDQARDQLPGRSVARARMNGVGKQPENFVHSLVASEAGTARSTASGPATGLPGAQRGREPVVADRAQGGVVDAVAGAHGRRAPTPRVRPHRRRSRRGRRTRCRPGAPRADTRAGSPPAGEPGHSRHLRRTRPIRRTARRSPCRRTGGASGARVATVPALSMNARARRHPAAETAGCAAGLLRGAMARVSASPAPAPRGATGASACVLTTIATSTS